MTEIVPVGREQRRPTDSLEVLGDQEYAASLLRGAIVLLDEMLPAEAENVGGLARCLLILRQTKADLAAVERVCEAYLAAAMPEKLVEVQHVGTLERMRGASRRQWDGAGIVQRLMVLAGVDPETGEIYDYFGRGDYGDYGDRIVRLLTECAGLELPSHSWRVSELRRLDINPDEFCEVEPGRPTVRIHGAAK